MQKIEERDRMRNARNLFKKIGNIKRTFHARMGMIKDRNGKDLTTEAEEEARIHRRTIQKKISMTWLTMMV